MNIRVEIKTYVKNSILPMYGKFDKAHQVDHANMVIEESLEIAKDHSVNLEMVYVIAAYHDLGLQFGRQNHEKNSGKILEEDQELKKWFNSMQIEIMKAAVEDHRASSKIEPRSIYGMIVAEADRLIHYETILYRTIQFGLKNYPNYSKEEQFERTYQHLVEKYGVTGYLKLWLKSQKNLKGLKIIHNELENKDKVKMDFEKIYNLG